jgi:hypothetical protein
MKRRWDVAGPFIAHAALPPSPLSTQERIAHVPPLVPPRSPARAARPCSACTDEKRTKPLVVADAVIKRNHVQMRHVPRHALKSWQVNQHLRSGRKDAIQQLPNT